MKIAVVLCAGALVLLSGCGKRNDQSVADVLGKSISQEEFVVRYRAFLAQGGVRDNAVARQQVLNNMANEILIYDDVHRIGLDRDPATLRRLEEIRLQALLDGYAKSISVDTMTVSEKELEGEFVRFTTKVSARYLYATTEEGARSLRDRLLKGESFATLAREVFDDPGLAGNGGSLGFFGWGEMEPALENVAYTLPEDSLSGPVRLSMGYAIVRVDKRVRQPLSSEYDFQKVKEKLRRTVAQRRTVDAVTRAVREVQEHLDCRFHDDVVQAVWRQWDSLMSSAGSERGVDLDPVLADNVLVEVGSSPWTVREFFRRFGYTSRGQRRRVKTVSDLRDVVEGLAAREALIARARALGLEKEDGVVRQVERVKSEYLLKRWAGVVQDTVGMHGWSERTIARAYQEQGPMLAFPPEVNVAEILVRTRKEAEAIRRQLDHGADFASLARKKSIRLHTAANGGELGFGTRSTFGPLGERFMAAATGSTIGPESVDPYVGVFRILAKRDGRRKTLDEARPEIIQQLTAAARREAFAHAVNALRDRSPVIIHMDALANVMVQ